MNSNVLIMGPLISRRRIVVVLLACLLTVQSLPFSVGGEEHGTLMELEDRLTTENPPLKLTGDTGMATAAVTYGWAGNGSKESD